MADLVTVKEGEVKPRDQILSAFNEWIRFTEATTPEEGQAVAALLLSAGAAFGRLGGLSREAMDFCVEQGLRSAEGEPPLPIPGSGNE